MLAEEFSAQPDVLYQILYNTFTVTELSTDQAEILKKPWKRIYTTNFDDAVESFYYRTGKKVDSYVCEDSVPTHFKYGSIVHLHGAIHRVKEENVLDKLTISESSYVKEYLTRSPWYDEFVRDVRFCAALYFIGYSLSDYHVSALLTQNPDAHRKTYFVTELEEDRLFQNRI